MGTYHRGVTCFRTGYRHALTGLPIRHYRAHRGFKIGYHRPRSGFRVGYMPLKALESGTKILRISYKDHVTNEGVRAKTQQAIGPHEDLLTIVKRHKLQWYGHISRSLGLAKTILQGTVKGERRKGRQRKRWEDIRKWTGLEFAKSQRAVENRGKWRKLVVKLSVVPQRPSWLRDRCCCCC